MSIVLLVSTTLAGSLLAPAVAQAVTYPSVTIVQPAPNTTVTGLTSVQFTAVTDPAGGDYPWSTSLYVDGSLVSGPEICNQPVGAKSCTQWHLWASDGLQGAHKEQIVMTTFLGVTVSSQVVTVNVVSPAPTASITSPTNGSTVSGHDVVVNATGTVDPSQTFDFPSSMTLLVDGLPYAIQGCGVALPDGCSSAIDWITTGFSPGAHTLQARFATTKGNSGTSAAVHVTLGPDVTAPVVTMTAPAANATVAGQVQVLANGTVASGEVPYYMILFVDHQPFGSSEGCPATTDRSCALSLLFDTAGMSGTHTLQVALFDTNGHEGLSAPSTVTISNPPAGTALVTLAPNATVQRGGTGIVTGTVADFATHLPLANAAVTVVFTQYHGPVLSVTVSTADDGKFTATAPAPLTSNTAVLASVGAALGSASATGAIGVTVPITCKVPASAHRLATVSVTCAAPDLAYNSVVALHFSAAIPHATDYQKVHNGTVTFTTSFSHAQQLKVWATTGTTSTFTASRSATSVIAVS